MNAQELFLKNGSPADIWFCSECRIVANNQKTADECCKKYDCKYCGNPVDEKNWSVHPECGEKNRIEKAEKLNSWDGWVFCDGVGNRFFPSVADLIEDLENEDFEIPEYVFVCKPIHFSPPDLDRIIDWSLEDHYEGAYDALNSKSLTNLSNALGKFGEENNHIVSYAPDYTKMVRVRSLEV